MSWTTEMRRTKARKRHRCDWCSEYIEPGEVYCSWTYGDPEPATARMHAECDTACGQYCRESYEGEFDPHTRARGCSSCERGDCEDPARCEARQAKEEHPV